MLSLLLPSVMAGSQVTLYFVYQSLGLWDAIINLRRRKKNQKSAVFWNLIFLDYLIPFFMGFRVIGSTGIPHIEFL